MGVCALAIALLLRWSTKLASSSSRLRRNGCRERGEQACGSKRPLVALMGVCLKRPRMLVACEVILLLGCLAYPLSTSSLTIDLEPDSIRTVTGEYTSRFDALELLRNKNQAPSQVEAAAMGAATLTTRKLMDALEAGGHEPAESRGDAAVLKVYYTVPGGRLENGMRGHIQTPQRLARIRAVQDGLSKAVGGWEKALTSKTLTISCFGDVDLFSADQRAYCPAIRSEFKFHGADEGFIVAVIEYLKGQDKDGVEVSYEGQPFTKVMSRIE